MPGAGEVGAALVADPRVQGVVFTGSTPVARLIEKELAGRLTRRGAPLALIAETGGLNAMVVDSSALAEQVVADVVSSAFDSAGQRCSALRILCLQDDVADRILDMLKGAMAELEVGDPRKLSVDVGPVITAEARDTIMAHIEAMSRPRTQSYPNSARRSGRARHVRRADPDRNRQSRRRRARGVRAGAARAAVQARGARRADRRHQRRRLRPHLRPPHPHRRDDRAGDRTDRSRQHLCQPQHHRRDGRRAAVRRLAALGHRPESRRPALSLAFGRRAGAGRARRRRRGGRGALGDPRLYRLASRRRPPGRGRALRRPHGALAARRARSSSRDRLASAISTRSSRAAGSRRSRRARAPR